MRRIENQRLCDAEGTQVFTTPRPDRQVPVEHAQCKPCACRPHRTTNTDWTGDQIAVTAIQHRNATAPARGNSAQVERRMPTWDNDNIWLRLCDRFRYRSHIDAQETVCIEPAARCRRLKNTVRIPVCEADVPVEGFTEADTL